jgi:hypothetical protein
MRLHVVVCGLVPNVVWDKDQASCQEVTDGGV